MEIRCMRAPLRPSPLPGCPTSRAFEHHLVDAVDLGQADGDLLLMARGHVLAHEVGPDGQLAVTAIDQHGQPDGPRATVVEERVDGRPDGPSGEEHVVDQHDGAPAHVEREVARVHHRLIGDADAATRVSMSSR